MPCAAETTSPPLIRDLFYGCLDDDEKRSMSKAVQGFIAKKRLELLRAHGIDPVCLNCPDPAASVFCSTCKGRRAAKKFADNRATDALALEPAAQWTGAGLDPSSFRAHPYRSPGRSSGSSRDDEDRTRIMAHYRGRLERAKVERLERYLYTLANDESATRCIPTEDDTRQASMRGDKHPESFNEERFDAVCSLCGLWIPGPEGGVCTNCEVVSWRPAVLIGRSPAELHSAGEPAGPAGPHPAGPGPDGLGPDGLGPPAGPGPDGLGNRMPWNLGTRRVAGSERHADPDADADARPRPSDRWRRGEEPSTGEPEDCLNCANLDWCPDHPDEVQREVRMGPAWMLVARPGTPDIPAGNARFPARRPISDIRLSEEEAHCVNALNLDTPSSVQTPSVPSREPSTRS